MVLDPSNISMDALFDTDLYQSPETPHQAIEQAESYTCEVGGRGGWCMRMFGTRYICYDTVIVSQSFVHRRNA
jgi:hypothetical protein